MTADRFKSCKAFVLDIFFPNRCPFCEEFIPWNELCCGKCRDEMTCADDVICRICGNDKCRCGETEFAFDKVYAAFFFDEARDAVYSFKYCGTPNFAELAAADIVGHIKAENEPIPDMIVPVPMGRKKQFGRGHNQAELFGISLGKLLGIPVRSGILFKHDEKGEQHLRGAKERAERVKELFYGRETDLSGKTVMLCDDVITTSSTMDCCAGLLKNMGAKRVIAAACAVTRLDQIT